MDLPYIGFNVTEEYIKSDESPDCSNLNESFPTATENNAQELFNFIRAADCLDLCSVETSKRNYVIPKGEPSKIPCRVNHGPVDQRVPVLFEPEETVPWPSGLMFSDTLLSVNPGKSSQMYVQSINTTEHDIILLNRILTGCLQLIQSVTPVDVKLPGVHSMNIWAGGCHWSSKILTTFIPCFKAKVRPINIPTRDQL